MMQVLQLLMLQVLQLLTLQLLQLLTLQLLQLHGWHFDRVGLLNQLLFWSVVEWLVPRGVNVHESQTD